MTDLLDWLIAKERGKPCEKQTASDTPSAARAEPPPSAPCNKAPSPVLPSPGKGKRKYITTYGPDGRRHRTKTGTVKATSEIVALMNLARVKKMARVATSAVDTLHSDMQAVCATAKVRIEVHKKLMNRRRLGTRYTIKVVKKGKMRGLMLVLC